jgi:hypothetical protein
VNKELERRILDCAMRRDDRRYTPLLVSVCEMAQYYDIDYVVDKMEKHYDGRDLKDQMLDYWMGWMK